ncbi:hypothetical protein [Clostridium sediminicola]|uniref:hypothetical protein n=1 Tax=Clostridium sediminicola TaxID=3114879 RepID=UPI003D170BFC
MGNSEARLHRKMGNQKAKRKLDGKCEALKSRLEKLKIKDKPISSQSVKFDIDNREKIYSKIMMFIKK